MPSDKTILGSGLDGFGLIGLSVCRGTVTRGGCLGFQVESNLQGLRFWNKSLYTRIGGGDVTRPHADDMMRQLAMQCRKVSCCACSFATPCNSICKSFLLRMLLTHFSASSLQAKLGCSLTSLESRKSSHAESSQKQHANVFARAF